MIKKCGFTLAEFLVVLAVTSVLLMAVMPVVTIRKKIDKYDLDAISCIRSENASNLESKACRDLIDKCKSNAGNSCDTMFYFAKHGKDKDKAASRKVLRKLCDGGAAVACQYFIDSCKKDSSQCDIGGTDDESDLRFYLNLENNSDNIGRLKIKDGIKSYYFAGNPNILKEVADACKNEGETACMVFIEACTIKKDLGACKTLIDSCTDGSSVACKLGHDYNLNKTCKSIRDIFNPNRLAVIPNPPATGIYKITPVGWNTKDGDTENDPFKVYCNMTLDDDPNDSEPAGGWTLVMKQKKGDGETLQGDNKYWTNADLLLKNAVLNDKESYMNVDDNNFISRGFRTVPVTSMLLLDAANEDTHWTHETVSPSAFQAFGTPLILTEGPNSLRPNWFVHAKNMPCDPDSSEECERYYELGSACNVFNHEQHFQGSPDPHCAVRWGWTADNKYNTQPGSHNTCGGLGAYGIRYGKSLMSKNKGIWQPDTLYLYVK